LLPAWSCLSGMQRQPSRTRRPLVRRRNPSQSRNRHRHRLARSIRGPPMFQTPAL
jgi:hypothetical protein